MDLNGLAHDALDAVVAWYASANADLPARRLVSLGQAPWDCEMVNVWVARDFRSGGNPADERQESIAVHSDLLLRGAQLLVQVARCYPVSEDGVTPPSIVAEENAAALVYADAHLLWRALYEANEAGRFSTANGVAYEGWTSIGPGGGMAGGVLSVRALL